MGEPSINISVSMAEFLFIYEQIVPDLDSESY